MGGSDVIKNTDKSEVTRSSKGIVFTLLAIQLKRKLLKVAMRQDKTSGATGENGITIEQICILFYRQIDLSSF